MNDSQPEKIYDFVVIGGGSAGYAAARTAIDLGLTTAVVDSAQTLGGLCILRGCMPSKALIETANRNLTIRNAAEFGLVTGPAEVDAAAVYARKRTLIDDFASYRQGQLQDSDFDLLHGRARYVDAETLEVSPSDGAPAFRITARTSLLATGSNISTPPIDGLSEIGHLTSDDILSLDGPAPDSVIVLGGGAIALEMAHFLDGIGASVTVIQRSDHLLSGMDHDVADSLQQALGERGIKIITGTKIVRAEKSGSQKTVVFEHGGETKQVSASEVLVALGRTPNTNALDLQNAGVGLDGKRISTTPEQRTTATNIFAAGDVCGPYEIVHIAIEQGEAAATNAAVLLGKLTPARRRTMDYRLKLLGIFTHPEVASVGLTEQEARKAGIPFKAATYPFDDHGKSMVMGETHGFVKLLANTETGELLGGSVVGPHAVDLIHEITVAMHFHATAADLAAIPHYHPTLSEIWTYPAEDLADSN